MDHNAFDLALNPTQRSLCVLVLDTSKSAGVGDVSAQHFVEAIYQAFLGLLESIRMDSAALCRARFALVCLGGGEQGAFVAQGWTDANRFQACKPHVQEATASHAKGISLACDLIDAGVSELKAAGIGYSVPRVVVITPNASEDSQLGWLAAADLLIPHESSGQLETYWVRLTNSAHWLPRRNAIDFIDLNAIELKAWLGAMFSVSARAVVTSQHEYAGLKMLGAGNTAVVYEVEIQRTMYAAKIYRFNSVDGDKKIRAMLMNPPVHSLPEVADANYVPTAWPVAAIRSAPSTPYGGVIMPLVDLENTGPLLDYMVPSFGGDILKAHELTDTAILKIAFSLAKIVAEIHAVGHYCVDLKPQNIRVHHRTWLVTLLDCDGWSINEGLQRYPGAHVSAEYIPPEVYTSNKRREEWGESQDGYVLAVLIFQMLNGGVHPFQGVLVHHVAASASNDDKASLGLYAYSDRPHQHIAPHPKSRHLSWHKTTRALFDRAFIGKSECSRPTAREWADHLAHCLNGSC